MQGNQVHKKTVHGIDVLEVKGDEGAIGIVLLHGYGADFEDLLSFSTLSFEGKKKPHFFFPRAPLEIPIAPGYVGRAWFPLNSEMLRNAENPDSAFPKQFSDIRFKMQNFLSGLNIPFSKLIVGGFSQGAVLALDTALNSFEKLKGVALFSGTLVHENEWMRLKNNIASLPFFQSHGTEDPLLSFERAKALEHFLLSCHAKGKLETFLGGHDIPHSIIMKFQEFVRKLL